MNTTLKTILIVLIILVVGGGLFFAGQTYSRWQSASFYGDGWMPMMGGRGVWSNNPTYGPMMGGGRAPMMGGGFGLNPANAQPLTIDESKRAAGAYLDSLDLSGLEVDEVMVFDNNAYVVVKEAATGIGAFELLVDPVSKTAYPEHGPNMMWNLKYSGANHQNMMGGGMMGRNYFNDGIVEVPSEMPITEEKAAQLAQAYLDQYIPGAVVDGHATAFYGYYTFDFSQGGKIAGMLSVNGYNGQAFYHSWHGTFIEETEMD